MLRLDFLPIVALALGLISIPSRLPAAVPEGYTGLPYNKTPLVIPGTIQAEEYDISPTRANDVTFHTSGRIGDSAFRRTSDSIGVADYGDGHVSIKGEPESPKQSYVGWTQPGQWLKYTVHVEKAGTYVFGGKFSAGDKGAKVSATFTPEITTGPVEIPTTAGYQPQVEVFHVWETLDNLAEVTLPAGTYVLTIKIEGDKAGMNFDYFTFRPKT